ncbi:hypothetical protein GLOTRDRAFT_98772 [Gloeophyllum trabeum ATCC 11539]|uniref:Transmembrane protein n=1 Tax=Gloeophyllum trabeum (strain ATCC 11539 / FP-39264 / Madison 617) TaxID=670483 RepID=S7RXH1_GLOTA|nr:uncharacterized protein GLOTRDRAFT_98772 [Gloeophyllum trabeum ATCC 11539]EPQ58044.1 hypothetical protein GLOTRDRAFT_98772 [Gloeophyllum trabeum ATCC 11539]
MFASMKGVAAAGLVAELLVSFLPGAYAQTSGVNQCTIYNWTENSIGQTPCLVASYLQGACNGGEYNIAPLPEDHHYIGPTQATANDCECNTVVYNLMSACGACQNRTIITWSTWSNNCSTVYNTYPESIPSGTKVPAWAYLNVSNDLWDYLSAQADLSAPESTATVQKSTGSVAPSTANPSSTSSSVPSGGATSSHNSNTGAIAGGVVGGVVGLAIIGGLIAFFVMRSRRRSQPKAASAMFEQRPMSAATTEYTAVPPFTPSTTKFYDPSDPSTYPPTVGSPSITTGHTLGYSPSVGPQQAYRPGQYTGTPEL